MIEAVSGIPARTMSRLNRTNLAEAAEEAEVADLANQQTYGLTSPLEYLLTSGGDPRLRIDSVLLLNGYGCQSWPRPEAFTFASSTATSISERGFAAAAKAQQRLVEATRRATVEEACDREAEWLREQLRTLLKLDAPGTEIIFSPSGTDSQLQALYVAQNLLQGPPVPVIVGSDETGSGTARAISGCHFSSSTAQGGAVSEGDRIKGFGENTARTEIPLRDGFGSLRSSEAIDREVLAAVSGAVAAGKSVVLLAMDGSKFGSRCPSFDCLREVKTNWGRSVQIVVDACQVRTGRRRIRYYLDHDFMVLVTGSKFFTGPPLSGALLVPAAASSVMKQATAVPAGLGLYTNRNDWPASWHGVRSGLPSRPNIGQLLRWAAAVEEMRGYFNVPTYYRALALQDFSRAISQLIADRANLRLLPAFGQSGTDALDNEEMGVRTIFPFTVIGGGKALSVEDCGKIYRALNRDVSALLPQKATAHERELAACLCHIGQPVGIPDSTHGVTGTLRISAGARVVSGTWRAAGTAASLRYLTQEFEQVRIILDKIDLLVRNIDALSEMDEANKRPSMREAEVVPSSSPTSPMAARAGIPLRLAHPSAIALETVASRDLEQGYKHG
jgi:hypothetical protein